MIKKFSCVIALIFLLLGSWGTWAVEVQAQEYNFKHGFSVWGDVGYAKNFRHFHYADPSAIKGGTIILAELGGFDSFNPFLIQGQPPGSIGLIYDTLMVASSDEVATQYGLIADGIAVSADKKTITFHINPNAKFQDGKKITSEDVAWTFRTILETKNPVYLSYYHDVADVKTEGDSLVHFTTNNPNNRELPNILGQLPILPKHFWQGKDFFTPSLEPPLGSGAYRITKFSASKFITYELNENYWAKNHPTQLGFNNFGALTYKFYRDSSVAFEAFKAGQIDVRQENISRVWATGYDFPALHRGDVVMEEIPHRRIAPLQSIVFNLRKPIFQGEDGRALRRALQLLWDFEWANKNLFYGAYRRTESIFDNSRLRAVGVPSPAELALLNPYRGELPKEVFGMPYQAPSTDNNEAKNRENILMAVKILQDHGFYYKGQELYSPKGERVEFTILLYDNLFLPILQPWIRTFKRIGGKANIRIIDSSVWSRQILNFNFDVIVVARGNSDSPGNEQREYWGSRAVNRMGGGNLSGVAVRALDEIIEKLITAKSYDEVITASRAMDRIVMWGYYFIPMYYAPTDRVAYWDKIICPDVFDKDKTYVGGFTLGNCWIDLAKEKDILTRQKGR